MVYQYKKKDTSQMKLAFLYEHPTWSDQLLAHFDKRNILVEKVNLGELAFPTSDGCTFTHAANRVNIMPSADRDPRVVFQTIHYLNWLEIQGVRIINGARAHMIGASKVMQNAIFCALNLSHPRAIAIYRPEDALTAAQRIGFPLIIKPNIGGSGKGIEKFDNIEHLTLAVKNKMVDLGIDHTALVQEYIQSDGYVYRIEVLGSQLFYSIKQKIQEGHYNYCAADGCSVEDGVLEAPQEDKDFDFCVIDSGNQINPFDVSSETLNTVIDIIKSCSADLGGVEYFVEAETGREVFYDINPYSNFVSNGKALLGFEPEERYIDYVLDCIAANE